MTDSNANFNFEEPFKIEWVTPQEAARLLGMNLRSVNRLIERGTLKSNGAKHGLTLSMESVEAAQLQFIAENHVNSQIDEQEAKSANEEGRAVRIAIATLQEERNKLASGIDSLQEARRNDALEIGRLQERVKQLEEQLQESRKHPPQTHTRPVSVSPIQAQVPPTLVRQETSQKVQPPKKSMWRRIFGG